MKAKAATFTIMAGILLFSTVTATLQQTAWKQDQDSAFIQAKSLFDSTQYSEAKKIFMELLQRQPQSAVLNYYLGYCFFVERDFDQADKYLSKAVKLCDTCADYHFMYGNLLFSLAGQGSKLKLLQRVNKGRAEMERTIALKPQNLPARFALIQFHLQAPGFLGGDKHKARQYVEEINRIDPTHYLSLAAKVNLMLVDNQLREAHQLLDNRMADYQSKTEKRQIGYLYNLIGYRYLHDKQCEQAKTCFKTYVSLSPNDANAHDSLGEAYYVCGDLDMAISEYQKALEINPQFENSQKMLRRLMAEKEKSRK